MRYGIYVIDTTTRMRQKSEDVNIYRTLCELRQRVKVANEINLK